MGRTLFISDTVAAELASEAKQVKRSMAKHIEDIVEEWVAKNKIWMKPKRGNNVRIGYTVSPELLETLTEMAEYTGTPIMSLVRQAVMERDKVRMYQPVMTEKLRETMKEHGLTSIPADVITYIIPKGMGKFTLPEREIET